MSFPVRSNRKARSVALRAGISKDEILSQLKGIRCPSTVRQQGMKCTSCPDAIARTIEKWDKILSADKAANPMECEELREKPEPKAAKSAVPIKGSDDKLHCPECGKLLRHEGGCTICDCGFSHCG